MPDSAPRKRPCVVKTSKFVPDTNYALTPESRCAIILSWDKNLETMDERQASRDGLRTTKRYTHTDVGTVDMRSFFARLWKVKQLTRSDLCFYAVVLTDKGHDDGFFAPFYPVFSEQSEVRGMDAGSSGGTGSVGRSCTVFHSEDVPPPGLFLNNWIMVCLHFAHVWLSHGDRNSAVPFPQYRWEPAAVTRLE